MAEVVTLLNGENVTIFFDRDVTDIIERFCGYELAKYVGETLEHHEETEDKIAEYITDWRAYDDNVESPYEHIDTLKDQSEDELDRVIEYLDSIRTTSSHTKETIELIKESLDKIKECITDMCADSDKLHDYIENIQNNF